VQRKGLIFDVELLLLAKASGFKIKEFGMPFVDTPGVTCVKFTDGIKMARQLKKIAQRYKSGDYSVLQNQIVDIQDKGGKEKGISEDEKGKPDFLGFDKSVSDEDADRLAQENVVEGKIGYSDI